MTLKFPLQTKRLLLRPFGERDLDALYAIHSRPDVTRYLYWDARSRDETRELLGRIRKMTGFDGDGDGVRLAALLKGSGVLVGDFSLWRTSLEHNQAEIGFIVHPDHHGKGYAREATVELLRIGFEEGRFHRIVGRCDGRNDASAGLMDRLGMRREAHLRENEFVKGEWTDELVYAMLESEWRERATGATARTSRAAP